MKKLKTALQSRYLCKIICLSIFIISILYTCIYQQKSQFKITTKEFEGEITNIETDGDKLSILLKCKEKLILNYYFKTKEEKKEYQKKLQLGDKIKVTGTLMKPQKNTVPNQFNYQKYLYHKQIFYILNTTKITKIENNTKIFYEIKKKIIKRLNKIDKTGYIKTFILGDKTNLDKEIKKIYQENGVSHLFAISGMHISLIATILLYILNKISYNNKIKYITVSIILLIYLLIANRSASIIRTVILFIITSVNKCLNLKISRIDLLLITLAIICTINSFIIYDIGFQFSYITSCFLIVFSKTKIKNKILNSLYVSYVCFLATIPICIYHFNEINILSLIFNIIMIPFVSIIVFPMSLITFMTPKLSKLFQLLIISLESINKLVNKIKIFKISFPEPNIIYIFFIYILIILTLTNKKNILFLLVILILLKLVPYINSNTEVTILDVNQGDSILIIYPHQTKIVLIDTGGKSSQKKEFWQEKKHIFSYIESKTIPYLKSKGINKINYLITTHGDFDHMGEAINLVNNFKVEKVIFNCGEFNDLEKKLIKILDKKKIKYYSCIKELNIDKNKLYFLQTKEYDNENDNSNVIYTELNGYKFMFMGDASITTEEEIMSKYNLPTIDVLKAGHHGSRTSSSIEFINEINPKYSIISVGKNNRYGHPNKEVLDNLDNSKIYRTDIDGSIMFKIKNNKLRIETCSP